MDDYIIQINRLSPSNLFNPLKSLKIYFLENFIYLIDN